MTKQTRTRNRWAWALTALVIVAILGVLAVRRSGAEPASADPALEAVARRGDLVIDVIETGKVQPREKVEIKSKVAGLVRRVAVKAGDRVKKGQRLLELDPLDVRRQVERAAADVDVARNAYEFAVLSVDRRRKGLEERGVAQVDLDAAESELRAKRAALRIAHVAQRAAADQLHYTRIDSPIDGTVIERSIGVGEVVTPGVQATFEGRALIAIADLSQLVVKAEVNQIDVAKLAVGQAVTVSLDALPGRSFSARVTWIAPASVPAKDKQVDVFPVEATLASADPAIRPGMVADVRIHVDKRAGAVILPIEAVVDQGGAHWVTTLSYGADGKQLRHLSKVEVGTRNDREIEIVSGIESGDRVVVRPPSAADNEFKM